MSKEIPGTVRAARNDAVPVKAHGWRFPCGAATVLLILAAFGAWGLSHLGGFAWSWDEGVLLMTARQLDRGASLYTEIWYNYPPLFPRMLAAVFDIFGPSAEAGRAMVLAFSLVLLGGVAAIGYRLTRDWLCALAAVLLLLLAPPFLLGSRSVMADLPALSLATWAIALTCWHLERPHWGWLLVAGALYGLSLAIKPTSLFAGLPLLVAASWLERDTERRGALRLGRVAAWSIGTLIALALSLLGSDLGAMLGQVAGSLADRASALERQLGANLVEMATYLSFDGEPAPRYVLLALLAPGLGFLVASRRRPQSVLLLCYWGTGVLNWLFYVPLYSHHLVSLLASSALVAAYGFSSMARWAGERLKWPNWLWKPVLLVLLLYLAGAGRCALHGARYALPADDDEDEDAIALASDLTEMISPAAYLVTDSLSLAFQADRQVPPELVNTSSWRIESGQLSAAQVIEWTRSYEAQAVVLWDDRLDALPEYVAWVQEHYQLQRAYARERRLYVPRQPIAEAAQVHFAGGPTLEGYAFVPPSSGRPYLDVTLHWWASERPAIAPQVIIEVFDEGGAGQAVLRTALAPDALAVHHWREDDRVALTYRLAAERLSQGVYRIAVRLEEEGVPLLASDANGATYADQRVLLPQPLVIHGP